MIVTSVEDAVAAIRRWGEARDWYGYDPYDALNSPITPFVTLGTGLGRRVLTQAVKRSPINLRPLLGIRPTRNAKAIGLVASGYARLVAAGDSTARPQTERWLAWLAENHSGGTSGFGWGYPFPVETRFFRYARATPNAIATSFVAQAFLDGAQYVRASWMDPALQAVRYVESHLLTGGRSAPYFRYLAHEDELVHNANLLVCAMLVRAGRADVARQPLETSLVAQRLDGSWPYAEGSRGGWVDNFHTGYVLESLAYCVRVFPEAEEPLRRGLTYWANSLFLDDGTPKYTPERLYPIDAHCYAQAIETWCSTGDQVQARRQATLLIERMLDPKGFVHFQRSRLSTNKVPFVRWTTAPAFRALAQILNQAQHAHLD